ncbi:TPA: hypothetical protein EYM26_03380 [Candidatus Poribacteria bacterium]|nr:hypothetical protein [Candidatus Poribacteria bacterium]
MSLNHTDIMLTSEDFTIYRKKGYWISPVLFDDEEVLAMRLLGIGQNTEIKIKILIRLKSTMLCVR